MPWLDASEIVLDGDIAGEVITVLRRSQTVNDFGEGQIAVTILSAIGSVVPVGSNSLAREEAYQTSGKAIRVITSFRLRNASETADGSLWQPDLVQWKGGNYLVKSLDDYSQYGAGLIVAECVLFDFVPPPPV